MSTKFLLTVALLLSAIGLAFLDKMTIDQYTEFAQWILGIYVGGNVVQKFAPPPEDEVK